LRQRGVSVIYISHFLEECQRICDRYTVLRDGVSVGTGRLGDIDTREIIRLMAGREIGEIFPRRNRTPGPPVLEVTALAGRRMPRDVTFTLRKGEILGLAGLIGAGRTETLRTCFGLDRAAGGSVRVFGRAGTRTSPARRLR